METKINKTICLIPYLFNEETRNIERIYLTQDPNQSSGYHFFEGEMFNEDPSSIFAATRVLLASVIDSTLFPLLEFNETHKDYEWENTDYQNFLGQMVEAPIMVQDDKLIFFYRVTEPSNLRETVNNFVSFEKFEKLFPETANELADALNPQVTSEWPCFGIFACDPGAGENHYYKALYKGLYQSPREEWKYYLVFNKEFPSTTDLERLKGIVMSGSRLAAYDKHEWYPDFHKLIRTIIYEYPSIKVFGICFGCQVTATALGGRVEKMELRGTPKCMNRETILLSKSENERTNELFEECGLKDEFLAVESHADNVVVLPEGAKLLGASEITPVEMFEYGNSFIGTQFHPEFNASYMERRILARTRRNLKETWSNIDEIVDQNVKQLMETRCDNGKLTNFVKKFLKEA